jgi:hypothetical protein
VPRREIAVAGRPGDQAAVQAEPEEVMVCCRGRHAYVGALGSTPGAAAKA